MIREDEVRKLVGEMREPFLQRPLGELDAVKEIKIKPEKRHVSVKVALAKTGTGRTNADSARDRKHLKRGRR